MIAAGIDIGSSTAKCIILAEGMHVVSWSLIPTGPDSVGTSEQVLDQALRKTEGVSVEDLDYIVSTGYGRVNIPLANREISEISCHAKGINLLVPEARTILDMGGQDCKAIRCDQTGKVVNFVMNDKCAAGTGRFLERVARTLNLELDEIGPLSLQTINRYHALKSQCAVFAQKEIASLLRQGKHPSDVLAGAFQAIARRMGALLNMVGIVEPLYVSGGVAKNVGVLKYLGDEIGVTPHTIPEAQLAGALGAALFAAQTRL